MVQIRHILTHHWRAIFFLIVLVVFFLIVYTLRSVLLPFLLGLLIAYILHPAILWLEKVIIFPKGLQKYKRTTVVAIVLLILLALIVLVAFYLVATLVDTINQLLENASEIVEIVINRVSGLLDTVKTQFSTDIQDRINQFFTEAGAQVEDAIQSFFQRSVSLIPTTIGFVLGFAALPMFLFYLLKDWERLRDGLHRNLPGESAIHTRNILAIIGRVLGRYLRAELLLGTIVGSVTFFGLLLMGVNFGLALLLALLAGFFEMVPTIGPWISGIFAVIIILATYPDLILWVIGLFLMVQLLENNLLVPRVLGQSLQIHPAVALLLLVLGAYLAGLWGIVLAVPLAATIVQIFHYTNDAARLEDHLPLVHYDPAIFKR